MSNEPPDKTIFRVETLPTATEETLAELEGKLEAERNARREERFGWILASVIVFDIFAFYLIQNWTGPLVIGVFEAIGLIVLAKRLGIDEVLPLFDRALSFMSGKLQG